MQSASQVRSNDPLPSAATEGLCEHTLHTRTLGCTCAPRQGSSTPHASLGATPLPLRQVEGRRLGLEGFSNMEEVRRAECCSCAMTCVLWSCSAGWQALHPPDRLAFTIGALHAAPCSSGPPAVHCRA